MKNQFIVQTARDYNMNYEAVKYIYDNYYPYNFYEKLEEYIKERANRNS